MPKAARYLLIWSPAHQRYELYDQDQPSQPLLHGDDAAWLAWLATHRAFAFHGQAGQLTLLKEARQRGRDGYWYAYRRQGGRMVKKYVGPSANLTIARLEATAHALAGEPPALMDALPPPLPTVVSTNAPRDVLPQPELLSPKLRLPHPQAALVARERLLVQLDAGLSRKLILIAAPAGFGKTTLLSQWVADRSAAGDFPHLAWVSLDSGDNDPIRFWRYVLTACRTVARDLEQAAALLAIPASLFAPAPLESVLTSFLNALSRLSGRAILMLEDYHVITEPRIHETLAFVLDHLPATMHVVLLTRREPPLPLARWRARNELYEVGAVDLRFSPEERATFLQNNLAFPLTAEAMRQLDAHLEGWPAGLRLITLVLEGHITEEQIEQ